MASPRPPARCRSYDDHDIERLAFIVRARGFGPPLEEITELLGVLDEERCAPVQERLRELVTTKIGEAQARIAEVKAFTAELEQVAATLAGPTPASSCDATCECTTS